MKQAKLLQFKQQVESITYEDILENRFKDLTYHVNEWCGDITISCTFTMTKTVWDSYRKQGSLGHIYNCDLSNYLHRKGVKMFYAVPTVNDRKPARNGIKTITVEFHKRGE